MASWKHSLKAVGENFLARCDALIELNFDDFDQLTTIGRGFLHHAARLPLIPGGAEALAAAEAAGAYMTAINGSGSSLLAVGPRARAAELATALGTELARFDRNVEAHALEVVHGAPVVRAAD